MSALRSERTAHHLPIMYSGGIEHGIVPPTEAVRSSEVQNSASSPLMLCCGSRDLLTLHVRSVDTMATSQVLNILSESLGDTNWKAGEARYEEPFIHYYDWL